MAHKTLIGGTAYDIAGGKTLIGGTGYDISGGKALIGGTGYDISFTHTWAKYSVTTTYGYTESNYTTTLTVPGVSSVYNNSTLDTTSKPGYFYLTPHNMDVVEWANEMSSRYPYFTPYANHTYCFKYASHTYYYEGTDEAGETYYKITTSKRYVINSSTSKGDFIEYVTSTDEGAYPTNGVSGSYWYVLQS